MIFSNKSSRHLSPSGVWFKSPPLKRWRSTWWIGWCFEDTSSLEFCVLWFRRSRGVLGGAQVMMFDSSKFDVGFDCDWAPFFCVVFRVSFGDFFLFEISNVYSSWYFFNMSETRFETQLVTLPPFQKSNRLEKVREGELPVEVIVFDWVSNRKCFRDS